MALTKAKQKRYSRQILLPIIDVKGQNKLNNATVTVVGLGALGSAIASNLTRAGVGNLRVVDRDVVEIENLHRQILYDEASLGKPKAMVAADVLQKMNRDIEITPIVKDVNFGTIETIISNSDMVLDGTDNLETRFLINDLSVKKNIPWIYGGVVGTQGMTMNIIPQKKSKKPCFRCLVSEMPAAGSLPTCDTYGIINTIPMIIASIQSTEAIKVIIGDKQINEKLIYYDVWSHEFRTLEIQKKSDCKCCVKHEFEYLHVKKRSIVTSLCGQNSVQITPVKSSKLSLNKFAQKLARVGKVEKTAFTLRFSIENYNVTIFSDGRALIKGTNDENLAKSLYTKYIGS